MNQRTVGPRALFAVVYSSLASAVYFAVGVIADHALGLTPVVLALAGLFFVLTSMTYAEGTSLHPDGGGATVFARHAFNELWSFIAGWAILLDYAILIAVAAFSATNYLAAFWAPLGRGLPEILLAIAIIAGIGLLNVQGITRARVRRLSVVAGIDIVLQVVVILLGLILVFDPHTLLDPIDVGTSPGWKEFFFALTIATVAFTGLESAAGVAAEARVSRRDIRNLVSSGAATAIAIYVGIAVVALTALPVHNGHTALGGRWVEAPILGVVNAYHPHWLAESLRYVVGAGAAIGLIAACNSAMLGLSRLAYSLATNRHIPSAIGRLHPKRATPYVVIALAVVMSSALVVPADLEFLIGIYAFGVMLAFVIAHAAVIVLRFREADRERPYAVPLSIRVGRGMVPIPAVIGAVASAAAWVLILDLHSGARIVGPAWMAMGLVLYLVYRTSQDKPVFRRVTIPEEALRTDAEEAEYGSILVPVLGTPLDDDIVQTAGRLASLENLDEGEVTATIEALYVIEVPLALPLDASLPEAQLQEARRALARAKAVGEEYEGVHVATAVVRARRAGHAIVEEARRRGVEAIVLAAEGPSRIRGGALLGGRGGPLDNFVGDATKYVLEKAECQVILTAPPADDSSRPAPETGAVGDAE